MSVWDWLGIILFGAGGVVFLVIGARMLRRTLRLVRNGVTTEGVVAPPRNVDDGLVVRFQAASGERFEIECRIDADTPLYRIGQRVAVVYNPRRPQNARIKDFLNLYLAPCICAFIGGGFLFLAFMLGFDAT